jgi:hypothetical protein
MACDLGLYPGNTWHSNILASSICSGVSTCYAQEAGLHDPSASTSVSTYTIINEIETIDWTAGAMPMTGNHSVQFDTATIIAADLVAQDAAKISDLSLQIILYGYYTLLNGMNYLPEVGALALGTEGINQSYPSVGSITNFNASLISGYLYETDQLHPIHIDFTLDWQHLVYRVQHLLGDMINPVFWARWPLRATPCTLCLSTFST